MSDDLEDPFDNAPPPGADPDDDPFAVVKTPAVSFKDRPVGTVVRFKVTRGAKMVQSRDFDTNEPKTWPDGNPVMSAVLQGTVDGERRSLWATKPSNLFNAIGEGQAEAGGRRIGDGDTLVITFTGEQPRPSGKKGNPQKLYTVTVER